MWRSTNSRSAMKPRGPSGDRHVSVSRISTPSLSAMNSCTWRKLANAPLTSSSTNRAGGSHSTIFAVSRWRIEKVGKLYCVVAYV